MAQATRTGSGGLAAILSAAAAASLRSRRSHGVNLSPGRSLTNSDIIMDEDIFPGSTRSGLGHSSSGALREMEGYRASERHIRHEYERRSTNIASMSAEDSYRSGGPSSMLWSLPLRFLRLFFHAD